MNKKNNIITEEEKSKLRQSAITKELYRLSKSLQRKKQIIVFHRIVIVIICVSFCSFIYFNKSDKSSKQFKEIKPVAKVEPLSKIDSSKVIRKTKPKITNYYTVYFENGFTHPLAQFSSKKISEEFCKVIHEMELPATKIVNDTIYRSRKNVSEENYPYRYAVQLGAYQSDILKKYRKNLIWIVDQQDKNYYKYQIAPFYGYSKSKQFIGKINLQDNYILSY